MAGKLRRGFKAEAERLSHHLRRQLGLSVYDRLNPFELADHLEVPVWALSSMSEQGLSPEHLSELSTGETTFSALTVLYEDRAAIVYNDSHSPARTANNITHELSHRICKHPSRPAIRFAGCREWDEEYEAEANFLSGAILVPRDGVFWAIKRGMSVPDGSIHFGVSTDLFRNRMNVTAVLKVLSASRRTIPR